MQNASGAGGQTIRPLIAFSYSTADEEAVGVIAEMVLLQLPRSVRNRIYFYQYSDRAPAGATSDNPQHFRTLYESARLAVACLSSSYVNGGTGGAVKPALREEWEWLHNRTETEPKSVIYLDIDGTFVQSQSTLLIRPARTYYVKNSSRAAISIKILRHLADLEFGVSNPLTIPEHELLTIWAPGLDNPESGQNGPPLRVALAKSTAISCQTNYWINFLASVETLEHQLFPIPHNRLLTRTAALSLADPNAILHHQDIEDRLNKLRVAVDRFLTVAGDIGIPPVDSETGTELNSFFESPLERNRFLDRNDKFRNWRVKARTELLQHYANSGGAQASNDTDANVATLKRCADPTLDLLQDAVTFEKQLSQLSTWLLFLRKATIDRIASVNKECARIRRIASGESNESKSLEDFSARFADHAPGYILWK